MSRGAVALLAAAAGTILLWLVVGTQPTLPELPRAEERWSGDYRSYFLPNAQYAAERLRHGQLPLWNPHQGAGSPFLATLQVGALYPPNALRAWLPAHRATLVLDALHIGLAVLLAGGLAAALGAGRAGSVLAGLAYGSSLQIVGRCWSPPLLFAATWAPGVLLAVDRLAARPSARWAVALAATIALSLLSGWPQTTALTALVAIPYAAALLALRAARSRRLPLAPAAGLAFGGAAGVLLAAPQLLSSAELVAHSTRALGTLVEGQAVFVARPHDPAIFAASLMRRGFNDAVPGPLPLALALLALLPGPGRGRAVLLLGAGVLGLLASFPNHLPVYGWLRELPLLGDFRFPYRFRLLSTLALAVAAGVGLGRLARALRRWPRAAGAASLAALALCVATSALPVMRSVLPFSRSAPAPRSVAAALEAVGVSPERLERQRIYWAGRAEKLQPPREAFAIQDLEPLTLARTAQLLTFFETGRPRTLLTLESVRSATPGDSLAAPFYGFLVLPEDASRAAILDLFSVGTLVSDAPPAWLDRRYRRLTAPGATPAVFENPHALPRAYRVSRALRAPSDLRAAAALLASPRVNRRAVALLDEEPPPALRKHPRRPAPPPSGATRIAVYEPERVLMYTRGADPAIVVLTDAHYPGWNARLDGRPVPLLRANLNFRAVAVPPGKHEIEMRYKPIPFHRGGIVALGAFVACVAVLVRAPGRPGTQSRRSASSSPR